MNLLHLPSRRALFLALTLFLTAIAHAQSSKIKITEATSDQSLWRVDLHTLGYPSDSRVPHFWQSQKWGFSSDAFTRKRPLLSVTSTATLGVPVLG